MSRQHAFDSALGSANLWLNELMATLELPASEGRRGLRALRAGLHAIRDRLPAAEVVDLGAQLPTLIRGVYYDGWRMTNDPGEIRDRAEMLARVRKEIESDDKLDAYTVLRAVISLLHKHVSTGELQDVIGTLPRPIATLWEEITGIAVVTDTSVTQPRMIRHTGYSR